MLLPVLQHNPHVDPVDAADEEAVDDGVEQHDPAEERGVHPEREAQIDGAGHVRDETGVHGVHEDLGKRNGGERPHGDENGVSVDEQLRELAPPVAEDLEERDPSRRTVDHHLHHQIHHHGHDGGGGDDHGIDHPGHQIDEHVRGLDHVLPGADGIEPPRVDPEIAVGEDGKVDPDRILPRDEKLCDIHPVCKDMVIIGVVPGGQNFIPRPPAVDKHLKKAKAAG